MQSRGSGGRLPAGMKRRQKTTGVYLVDVFQSTGLKCDVRSRFQRGQKSEVSQSVRRNTLKM
jgi:hypothetical protein